MIIQFFTCNNVASCLKSSCFLLVTFLNCRKYDAVLVFTVPDLNVMVVGEAVVVDGKTIRDLLIGLTDEIEIIFEPFAVVQLNYN